jgi:branched-chain amino acid transport system ATP-binding protein
MLKLESISVSVGGAKILTDVTLEVSSGEIVGVLGPNGAGKTTILNAVAGRMKVQSGEVIVDGENWGGLSTAQRARRGLGYVPEGRGLFPNLSVDENLRIVRVPLDEQLLERLMGLFPQLLERRRLRSGSLSGGEQQMLALARAFAARPKLLLLDEPTLGLSPTIVERVAAVIRVAAESGHTVILAEQNAVFTRAVSDRVYLIGGGRVHRQIAKSETVDVADFLGIVAKVAAA